MLRGRSPQVVRKHVEVDAGGLAGAVEAGHVLPVRRVAEPDLGPPATARAVVNERQLQEPRAVHDHAGRGGNSIRPARTSEAALCHHWCWKFARSDAPLRLHCSMNDAMLSETGTKRIVPGCLSHTGVAVECIRAVELHARALSMTSWKSACSKCTRRVRTDEAERHQASLVLLTRWQGKSGKRAFANTLRRQGFAAIGVVKFVRNLDGFPCVAERRDHYHVVGLDEWIGCVGAFAPLLTEPSLVPGGGVGCMNGVAKRNDPQGILRVHKPRNS